MVPFVSRMICRSVRITKCKSRSKVETVNSFPFLFRQGTKARFQVRHSRILSSSELVLQPFWGPAKWVATSHKSGGKILHKQIYFEWYYIFKFTFDPFITLDLMISYNSGRVCTMYNFTYLQSLTSNYSSEGFVQITPQLVRFWIISTGLSNVQDYWTLKRLSSLQDKDASWPDRKDPVQSGPCKLACLLLQYDLWWSISLLPRLWTTLLTCTTWWTSPTQCPTTGRTLSR